MTFGGQYDSTLTNLPPELIIRILEDLPGRDIGRLSRTCTQLRSTCRTDIIWQKLCQKICDIAVEEWNTTYYNIFTKVLHRYGRCLGMWRRNMRPYGGLMQIKVDNGRLLATEYKPPYVSDIHGPLRPKKVFSIGINKFKNRTEILCLHGYGEAHPGSIEFETEESDVVFKCCQMSSHAHPKGSSVELSTMIKKETNNHTIPFTIDDQKRLECYMKNVPKYRLTRIEVQRPGPVYPIQPGLFLAHYSAHGIEMFLLKYDMNKKEAEVIKITGDPNVPAGETSIYINLRKPMQLTKDQQLDVNSLLLLEEEDIPDSDDVQPRNQPFVIPPGFSTFLDDFTPTTCEYRYFGRGRIAGDDYMDPYLISVHVVPFEANDVFFVLWFKFWDMDGFYRIKDFNI